jgi:hypothetical protein
MISKGNRMAVAGVAGVTACIGLGALASASSGFRGRPAESTPPQTKIVKAKVKRQHALARFRFTSSEPSSTFRCKLDGHRSRSCSSPTTYRHLKDGRHTFRVKAIAPPPNGVADPTWARRRIYIGPGGPPFPPFEDVDPAHMLSGDDCGGFISPEVFFPVRNGWAVGNRGRSTLVCAGGAGDFEPSTTGRFVLLRTSDRWGTQELSKVDVPKSGPLRITRAPLGRDVVTSAQRRGNLVFRGTQGITGTLHLKDDSVTVDP